MPRDDKNTSVFVDGDFQHRDTEAQREGERSREPQGGRLGTAAAIDRKDWKRVRLGEVLLVCHGKCQHTIVSKTGKHPILATSGEIGRTNSYLYNKPSVLIGRKGTIDKPQYIDTPFWTIDTLFYTKIAEGYNSKFLYYLCLTIDWASMNEASGVPSLSANRIESLEVTIPNIDEQNKIADALSSIDKHISTINILIAKYEAIKKATVNLLLKPKAGWRQITLSDIGDVLMCKRILKNQTTETGDVPFYKIGTFGKTPDSFISRSLFEDFKARFSYPNKGDVLLSAAGTIGRTVVFNGEDAYFQDSNIVWIDNNESIVTNRFLNVLYGQMDWQTENGGTVSRLYNANIRNTRISIPTLTEQKRIVGILDSIDGTINGLKSQLAKAKNIKQGMMSYFFG